jgi:hypothetical protein
MWKRWTVFAGYFVIIAAAAIVGEATLSHKSAGCLVAGVSAAFFGTLFGSALRTRVAWFADWGGSGPYQIPRSTSRNLYWLATCFHGGMATSFAIMILSNVFAP